MSFYIKDKTNRENCELTSAITLAKHSLNEHLISEAFENFNEKLQIKNSILFYQLAVQFNLTNLNNTVLRYIERCFSIIVDTECFLELDINTVSKILASSSLQIDSEIEIYNAANKWLNHNSEERSKFAKQLLLKVRLNLLSDHCLQYLINDFSCISTNVDCIKVLKNRDSYYQNVSTIHNKSRQCNQNMFNILTCGCYNNKESKIVTQVKEVTVNNFKKYKNFPSMLEERHNSKAVYLKGEVYVIGGLNRGVRIKSVEKYSSTSKKWVKVTNIPDKRQYFCACAFLDDIYLFGGHNKKSG